MIEKDLVKIEPFEEVVVVVVESPPHDWERLVTKIEPFEEEVAVENPPHD